MKKHENIQFDDIAHVLCEAHVRRSAEVGSWLKQLFEHRSRTGQGVKATSYLRDRISSLIAAPRRPAV
jgi:hypothetical protein